MVTFLQQFKNTAFISDDDFQLGDDYVVNVVRRQAEKAAEKSAAASHTLKMTRQKIKDDTIVPDNDSGGLAW